MKDLLIILNEFNFVTVFIKIIVSALLGGLIGMERGRHGRAAGLRTHILVCIGASMTSLISLYLSEVLGYSGDIARISAQVISGIGFLGAGTIMIKKSSVITGLTTAAGMWATAIIGIATGYGFYSGAIIATLVCIFCITFLNRLEINHKKTVSVYIEFSDIEKTNEIITLLKSDMYSLLSYDIIPAKSGINGNVGILCFINNKENYKIIKSKLENENISIIVSNINT